MKLVIASSHSREITCVDCGIGEGNYWGGGGSARCSAGGFPRVLCRREGETEAWLLVE